MHDSVAKFAQDLYDNSPTDLAEWLGLDSERRERHFREFDLDNPADPRRVEDAEKVLPELIRCASEGRTMTFTEFCRLAERGNPRTLVVRADTGLGSGYWREHTDEEKVARQEECFAHYNARRAEALPAAKTARRQPAVATRETCGECDTERTPSGACLC